MASSSLAPGIQGLTSDVERVAERLRSHRGIINVLTHYDADGLVAGGLVARFLSSIGREFLLRTTVDLTDDVLSGFLGLGGRLNVFVDLGSGDLDRIIDMRGDREVVIIDHHKLSREPDGVTILNPELHGFDGGATGCASILSGLLGYQLTGDPYFLGVSLVGAAGDMQLANPVDVTKMVLDKAVEMGVAEVRKDFIFFSSHSLPLHKAITWSFNPYIPHFTGRDDVGLMLVKRSGIDYDPSKGRTVDSLNDLERNRLLEVIVQYIAGLGIKDLRPGDLIRNFVVLRFEEHPLLRHVDEFANLVNTTGRMGEERLGLLLAYGVRGGVVDRAIELYMERRRFIAKYLEMADRSAKIYDDTVAIVDLRGHDFNPRFSGTISTILSRSLKYQDKVVILLARSERGVKLSARAPRHLVERGFNLAEIMRDLSKRFSGIGGGHNVAAGATLEGSTDTLVKEIVEAVKSRLG